MDYGCRSAHKSQAESEATFVDQEALLDCLTGLMVEDKIDFIACPVTSHWHAIGVDALAQAVSLSRNGRPSGVVVIAPHGVSGFLIDERDFAFQSYATARFLFLRAGREARDGVVRRMLGLSRRRRRLLLALRNIAKSPSGDKTLIRIASVLNPNADVLQVFSNGFLADRYHPIISLIDEGMGSYVTGEVWKLNLRAHGDLSSQKEVSVRPLLLSLLSRTARVPGRLLQKMVVRLVHEMMVESPDRQVRKQVEIEKRHLFRKEGGRLVPEKELVESYRAAIEKRSMAHDCRENPRPLSVVLTQPFSEYGRVPLSCELEIINEVIGVLLRKGFDVILKPHPREHTDKYGPTMSKFRSDRLILSRHDMPVEELFPVLEPACVVGYTSTALLVASGIYGIPTVSIVGMMLGRTDDEFMTVHGNEFSALAVEMCSGADTIDSLEQVLTSILDPSISSG